MGRAVVTEQIIECARQRAFGAGAIVAFDVDDQRVIEPAFTSTSWITRPISWSV
jgi:hypothetical protein